MATKLLSRGDPYSFFALDPKIIDESLFPSGVVYDQITKIDKFFTLSFLRNIFQREKKETTSELFSNILELKTSDLRKSNYTIISTGLFTVPYFRADIILRNKEEISTFLESHSEIGTYLYEAERIIHKYFPDDNLEAELITDFEPEITDQKKTLFLYIVTNLEPQKALDKLEKIDEEMFDNLQADSQFFNINLEFKS